MRDGNLNVKTGPIRIQKVISIMKRGRTTMSRKDMFMFQIFICKYIIIIYLTLLIFFDPVLGQVMMP
jgi:hypothetical protein